MPNKYWKYDGLNVVMATHPKQKNFDQRSRSRCKHLRKADDKEATLCNLFVTECHLWTPWNSSPSTILNSKLCIVCFKDRFDESLLKPE